MLLEAIDKIKQHSRNLSKKLLTFFNNQFDVNWINVDLDNFERLDEHRESVSAYYFLLETLKYSRDPFEVEKVFKKNGINYNSKIIKTVDWSTV